MQHRHHAKSSKPKLPHKSCMANKTKHPIHQHHNLHVNCSPHRRATRGIIADNHIQGYHSRDSEAAVLTSAPAPPTSRYANGSYAKAPTSIAAIMLAHACCRSTNATYRSNSKTKLRCLAPRPNCQTPLILWQLSTKSLHSELSSAPLDNDFAETIVSQTCCEIHCSEGHPNCQS